MATKTVAWNSGSGVITLTYTGQGNGSVSVKSDSNDSFDERSQNLNIVTTAGSPEKAVQVLVKQAGKPLGWTTKDFGYTGSVQEVTLPKGRYKLQCWGAQGGNVTGTYAATGSKGGYSEGIITLTATTTLYIFVGGKGTDYTSSASQTDTTVLNGGWNGGGAGKRTSRYNSGGTDGRSFPRGGGGATDISTVTSAVSYSSGRTTRDSASLLARCIVAGGGAGASAYYKEVTTSSTTWEVAMELELTLYWHTSAGRHGYLCYIPYENFEVGGVYKFVAHGADDDPTFYQLYVHFRENQNDLGSFPSIKKNGDYGTIPYYETATRVEFCSLYTEEKTETITATIYKQVSTTNTSTDNGVSNQSHQGGGISGRGTYGGSQSSAGSGGAFGLGANQTSANYRYAAGGGGGGWYGGGTGMSDSSTGYIDYTGGGSGFVNTVANASYRPSGYTGLQLDSGSTTAGNSSHPSVSGGTEVGHSGNGYARITVIN